MQVLEKSSPISVPKICSATEVSDYVRNGYHIAPQLLDHDEIAEILSDAPKLIRGEYAEPLNPIDLPANASDEEVLSQVLCMHQPHFFSPVIEKYVKHPKICGVLSQLAGAHLAHWDGSVKCMQSMYFVKPPEFQGQAWHQDEIYIPTRDRTLTGAWIALDDAVISNGCLWVIPGSHQSGVLFPQKTHDNKEEFDSASISYGFDDSTEIPVEVPKGSVVFFNGYLLHRSQRNRSANYRRVLVNHYMSSASFLPWSRKTDSTVAAQDDRCVLQVAGQDPYAYKGYTKADYFHFRPRC
jgi:phytanoyl-CoA hydroxylase